MNTLKYFQSNVYDNYMNLTKSNVKTTYNFCRVFVHVGKYSIYIII